MEKRSALRVAGICLCCWIIAGCGYGVYQLAKEIQDAIEEDTQDDELVPTTAPVVESAQTYAIALGGVAPGRDELILTDTAGTLRDLSGRNLTFSASTNVIGLLPRPGRATFADGSGAQLVPQQTGTALVRYQLDGAEQPELFGVTVPPQALVQVLLGEARGLLKQEAAITANVVQLASRSPSGDAVAAVVRNRRALIDAAQDPALFSADPLAYYLAPPTSAYTAIIEAMDAGLYQFSPVDPNNTSHDAYTHAEARSFLAPQDQFAYDQAVLTAAAIFDGRTEDPTGGAFAFRSPTVEEAACLMKAAAEQLAEIPTECGPGDENFPALAPVQILIHPNVGTQADGRPAFVFYRKRPSATPPVTNQP